MSRAAGLSERPYERLAETHQRRDAAPLVSDRRLVAAISRSLLLADGADDPLGIHPDLPEPAIELLCAGGRRPARGCDAVGRSVPRTDRTRDLVLRGSLFAQSRPF